MRKLPVILLAFLFFNRIAAQDTNNTFIQPVSVKYNLSEELKGSILKKVVADYDAIIYVLTDKGVGRMNIAEVVKDLRYRSLANKIPLDITIQEGTGYLYYLYNNAFLSNTDTGIPFQKLPAGKYNKIAVAADGQVLVTGDNNATLFKDEKPNDIPLPADKIIFIEAYKKTFYALSPDEVYRFEDNKIMLLHKGKGLQAFAFRQDEKLLGKLLKTSINAKISKHKRLFIT